MKRSDFLDFLIQFSKQPIPATLNRHIYLWVGEVSDLTSASPTGFLKNLDLHALCKNIIKAPSGDKAAGRALSEAIEDWKKKYLITGFPRQQQALLITGLDLLYRYRLPLSGFIRLSNENCLVIFGLSQQDADFHPSKPLPSYIQYSPNSIRKYFSAEIPEEAILKEG